MSEDKAPLQKKGLGQLAFEAYTKHAGGVTYDNKPIPTWENLSQTVRDHWIAAAAAVAEEVIDNLC